MQSCIWRSLIHYLAEHTERTHDESEWHAANLNYYVSFAGGEADTEPAPAWISNRCSLHRFSAVFPPQSDFSSEITFVLWQSCMCKVTRLKGKKRAICRRIFSADKTSQEAGGECVFYSSITVYGGKMLLRLPKPQPFSVIQRLNSVLLLKRSWRP